MKKGILALCIVLLFSITTRFCFADDSSMTILSVSFSRYIDEYGLEDDTLIVMAVRFSAPETVTQVTMLLAGENITHVTSQNKNKVIYMDQLQRPVDNTIRVILDTGRVASACGKQAADGSQLYLKIGGNGASLATYEVVFGLQGPAYGDVNGDGEVDLADAMLILRYEAELTSLTTEQLAAADVVRNGRVGGEDAVRILRYEARLVDELLK